jgi:hypothetical protein
LGQLPSRLKLDILRYVQVRKTHNQVIGKRLYRPNPLNPIIEVSLIVFPRRLVLFFHGEIALRADSRH